MIYYNSDAIPDYLIELGVVYSCPDGKSYVYILALSFEDAEAKAERYKLNPPDGCLVQIGSL